ncbi:dihydrolipoamide acetyltransferase family protein [Paenibacillus sp. y28]|uniref:dihydrolipoamide acetyltransferase family protein n=1 Tax=Paenibacillus sp. y28 TaxID=3129110 RepID=UPI00301A2137
MSENNVRITEVTVPHLAESLVSATVSRWMKQPGDDVEQYEVLCELITDKVNVEMPSPIEGRLLKILVGDGETADVGAPMCLIEEPVSGSAAGGNTNAGTGAAPDSGNEGNAAASLEKVAPAAAKGGQDRSAVLNVQATADQPMRARFSPAVQSLAAEHGIDLNQVNGSGLGGRITRKDVLLAVESGAARLGSAAAAGTANPQGAAAGRQAGQIPEAVVQAAEGPKVSVRTTGLHLSESVRIPSIEVEGQEVPGRGEYIIDVTPIRSTIARNTRQSATEIPHAWTMIEVDVTNLVLLRNKLKDEFIRKEGINLTYLAFVMKAVVNAIKDYPIMNSVWATDKIIVKRDINISLLVGTEDSVLNPVIKQADQKNIAGLAHEIDELTKKARAGRLSLNDIQGGTFTVNNTGSFGSILSYPIIVYPQAANMTFESIVKKPVVIQDMIAVRSMVNLCLSLDHRILDGVICGSFLQRVKENLESYGPETKLY